MPRLKGSFIPTHYTLCHHVQKLCTSLASVDSPTCSYDSIMINLQTVPAIGGQGTTRTTAAIKLFESKQRPQDSSSKLYSRSIEKPVKTLAIAQDAQKKPPKEDSRTKAHTTVTDEVDGSRPSWAALTQVMII